MTDPIRLELAGGIARLVVHDPRRLSAVNATGRWAGAETRPRVAAGR